MTANDVFKTTLALLFEDEQNAEEYRTNAVFFINLLLPELFDINNGIRKYKEKVPLTEIPLIADLNSTLTYEDEITRAVLPYALAAKLVYDDADMSKVAYFHDLYVNAANSFSKMVPHDIEDVYA